jgi:hypothetical protein
LKIEFLSLEEMFDPDRVVTSHEGVTKGKGGEKLNPDGIYSEELFGKLNQEIVEFVCPCGDSRGRFYAWQACRKCGEQVVPTEPSIKRMAWIDLGDYPIINPNFYRLMSRLCPKVLPRIVDYDVRLTKKGSVEAAAEGTGPYDNAGLIRFVEEFPEIVQYLASESKLPAPQRDEIVEMIMENADKVFITKIPMFSSSLRPAIMIKDALVTDELNNTLNMIVSQSNLIKEASEEERTEIFVLPLLYNIQELVNQLFDGVIAKIKSKGGFIRNNVMSNRLNFSGRAVITPLHGSYDVDDIVLPYLMMMELYRFHLINLTQVTKGVGLGEADRLWHRALSEHDADMASLMNELITKTKDGLKILFNRNPTINFGSILLLRVAGVKKDYHDLTASINNLILKPLGADYDGDTLNIVPIMDNRMKRAFEVFSPKRMFINRNDGLFNESLSLDKDMILGLSSYVAN